MATSTTRDPPASDESRASGTGSGRGSQRKESHTQIAQSVTVATAASWGNGGTLQDTAQAPAITLVTRAGTGKQAVGGRQGGFRGGAEALGVGLSVERLAHPPP